MPIHIGNFIKHKATEKKYSQQDVGDLIGRTKQNVGNIYKRHSIDSDMLCKLCCVLEYDFFILYRENFSFTPPYRTKLQRLEAEKKSLKERIQQAQEVIEMLRATIQAQQTAIALLEQRKQN